MLVSDANKILYCAIPRTGSKSMYRWLMPNYGCVAIGERHDAHYFQRWKDYTRIIVVRNPFDRARSMWQREAKALKDPFEAFIKRVYINMMEGDVPSLSQAEYVRRFKPTHILRLERLNECVECLPFFNKSLGYPEHCIHRKAGPEYPLTAGDRQLVREIYAEDFQTLGYDPWDPPM